MASPNEAGDSGEDLDEIKPVSTEPINISPAESSQCKVSEDDNGGVAYAVHSGDRRNEQRSEENQAHSENKKRAYMYNNRLREMEESLKCVFGRNRLPQG